MTINQQPASTSSNSPGFRFHLLIEGAIPLGIAFYHFAEIRGLSIGLLMMFMLPPLTAFAILQKGAAGPGWIAFAFLLLIAAGALVAPIPALFPKLGGMDRRLPAQADRLLTFYVAIYLFFAMGLVPTWAFVSSLIRHRRGQPARLSRFTCYLGLSTVVLLWPGVFALCVKFFGLWPMM